MTINKSNIDNIYDFEQFNILVGMGCNQSCRHCTTNSSPSLIKEEIDNDEISKIIDTINANNFREVMFSGGEPSLYYASIEKIMDSVHKKIFYSMTTNGQFLYSDSNFNKINNIIKRMKRIYISIDSFHRHVDVNKLCQFRDYLSSLKIDFALRVTITDPLEIVKIKNEYKDYNFKLIWQKCGVGGRAKMENLSYKYIDFDENVLNQKCPSLNILNYIPKKGFSNCCANLVFNSNLAQVFSSEYNSLKDLSFLKYMQKYTFGDLIKKKQVQIPKLTAEMSDPCYLCEQIWEYERN